MPTYEYRCRKCNHGFDLAQSFHDAPLLDCPECKSSALQKVIHASNIVFKGSGFYKTDSSSSSSAVVAKTTVPPIPPAIPKKETPSPSPASPSPVTTS